MASHLSHIDSTGNAHMVDVGAKQQTFRVAIAKGEVVMHPKTLSLIAKGNVKKGDVLNTAQLAGIMAAKKTPDLVPLCHPLPLSAIDVDTEIDSSLPGILITARVKTFAKTGVEMEALTAVVVAALTIYDMAKAVDKKMRIQNVRLIEKHGGTSGDIFND